MNTAAIVTATTVTPFTVANLQEDVARADGRASHAVQRSSNDSDCGPDRRKHHSE